MSVNIGNVKPIFTAGSLKANPALDAKKEESSFNVGKFEKNILDLIISSIKNVNPLQPSDPDSVSRMYTNLINLQQTKAQMNMFSNIENTLNDLNDIRSLASLIGRKVQVESNSVMMKNGKAEIFFRLPENIQTPVIGFFNDNENLLEIVEIKKGDTSYTWSPKYSINNARGVIFKIMEKNDLNQKDVSQQKGYYSTISEVIQEEGGKYVLTDVNHKIKIQDIKHIRA